MKAVTLKGRALACVIMVALCALLATPGIAPAAPLGSISLVCMHERGGVSAPVARDRYVVVAVAAASVENGGVRYATLPAFEEVSCDWSSLDAGGLRERSKAAHEVFLRDGIEPVATIVTDDAGRARAAELAAGIYLVVRIETAPQNEDVLVDPVLVGVPATVDGKLEYDVVAYPKFEDAPGLEPDRPGGLIPGFDLPTTGDMQLALVGVLLLLGTATLWSSRRVAEGSSDSSAS